MTERMTQEQDRVVAVPLEEEERPASGLLRGVLEVVQALAIAVLISVGLNLFVVQVTEVRQRSMEDTLDHGDRVLVSKVDYRLHPPQRSDIVVFRPPIDANIPFVKRVIAIAGDTVEIRDGRVLVNDVEVSEQYVIGSTQARAIRYPYVVPAGSVFVMGDNRPVSGDSREWGAVRDEEIIGKVVIRFWPLGKMHFFDW